MRSMEWPDRSRRLAGVDQALGDGQARAPAELLDQLRERLGRLEPGHPSSTRQSPADRVSPGDVSPDDVSPGAPELPELADQSRQAAESDGFGGAGVLGEVSGDFGDFGPGGVPGGLSTGPGALDAGRAGRGDPYRPWFMAGDSGPPWFAE